MIIFSVLVAAAAAYVVMAFLGSEKTVSESRFVADTFAGLRKKDDATARFEVDVDRVSVNDVFNSFEAAEGDGYISMDEINGAMQDLAPANLRDYARSTLRQMQRAS